MLHTHHRHPATRTAPPPPHVYRSRLNPGSGSGPVATNSLAWVRVLAAWVLLAVALPGHAQTVVPALPEDPDVREGYLAWDRGAYPQALRYYLQALEGGEPDVVRQVAALTGEVHPVLEVTADGASPRVAADGGLGSYEVRGDSGPRTVVFDLETGEEVTSVAGTDARIGGGLLVYTATAPLPEALVGEAEAAGRRLAEATDRASFIQARSEVQWFELASREVRVMELGTGADRALPLTNAVPLSTGVSSDGTVTALVMDLDGRDAELLRFDARMGRPERISLPEGFPMAHTVTGGTVVVEISDRPVGPLPPGASREPRGMSGVYARTSAGAASFYPYASQATVSADGTAMTFLRDLSRGSELVTVSPGTASGARVLWSSDGTILDPVISPDGLHVAFGQRPVHDWELFVMSTGGEGSPRQLSNEVQHDRRYRWVDDRTVLAAKGEGRHMRSYLYEVDGGEPLKLFHNNSIRTIAPEYDWVASPAGGHVVILAERDGDTVSPERGVYVVDRTRTVDVAELRARLEVALAREQVLRSQGLRAFRLISGDVRAVVDQIQVERISAYARDLYRMGSKHISQPGNRAAMEYLEATLRGWGYEPELQWFEPRPGIRTANVIVRVPGTVDPELVYVVSSHFDSVERGPGADDNSSGTSALLEVARVLRDRPLPATVELAFFTGEEAGLLGSREYVRRAVAGGRQIVGALNNDMVGWANDHRLDNTIRYSNPGIRDIQHAAAIIFSDLITYDALYYKSTDAAAYYEAYGDIVGGIGSYPVLGNPHYHQATDRLETINHRLVTEVARTTAASIMLLASAPSRLEDAVAEGQADYTEVRWRRAPESDVVEYLLTWEDETGTLQQAVRSAATLDGEVVRTRIPALTQGTRVSIKARNGRGHLGWDWAHARVTGS